jgi:hypothetical protein
MGRIAHEFSELVNGFYTVRGSQMFCVNFGSNLVRLCLIYLMPLILVFSVTNFVNNTFHIYNLDAESVINLFAVCWFFCVSYCDFYCTYAVAVL